MEISKRTLVFPDMCAPKITFLNGCFEHLEPSQHWFLTCGMADMLESRKMGLWLRKAFPLHYSDGQSLGSHTLTHTHTHVQTHKKTHCILLLQPTKQLSDTTSAPKVFCLCVCACSCVWLSVIFVINDELCTTGHVIGLSKWKEKPNTHFEMFPHISATIL